MNGMRIETPLLYLRGEHEGGNIDDYIDGFKGTGILNVQSSIIPDSSYFAPEEQPEEVWELIVSFLS